MGRFMIFVGGLAMVLLSSCGHIYTKKDTYSRAPGVKVNDALVTSAVDPQGDKGSMSFSAMVYMAGAAKLVGPFRWRIEAEGKEGVHESLTIHRLKVTTEKTKRSEWFPPKHLGSVSFKPVPDEEGVVFAAFQLPGTLKVFPEEDGPFSVTADLSIRARGKTKRRLVSFTMVPNQESGTEFLFLPGEIAKGWKRSPRDWDW